MEHSIEYPIPVVTNDDVRVIQRYVREGKNIPTTEKDISAAFPSAPEYFISEMKNNYTTIYSHAMSWEQVEQGMIDVSSILVSFAKDICEYGNEAIETIKNMEGYKSRKISSLNSDELNALPRISLDGDDQSDISNLIQTVDYIKSSITDKKRRTTVILKTLETFQKILVTTIEPWIGSMIRRSNPDALSAEISNLRLQLIKQQDALKEAKLGSSKSSNFLDWMSDHMYDGVYAPKSDEKVKDFVKRIEDLLNKLRTDNSLKGFLETLYTSMGSLYDVVTPAIKTVTQLNAHWDTIILLIDHSSGQFKNYALLGLFVRKLETTINDWQKIRNNSTALMNAFRI